LLKNKENLIPYLTMMDFFFTRLYLKEKAQEDRAIIYVSTRDMANEVIKFLKKLHPELVINRFMQGDSYDVIQKSQVVVSTIGSAGTGHDMANLTRVFMLVNVASPVANAQTLGRLREIHGKEVKFIYFFSVNIPKQVANHYKRKEMLAERSATFKEITYSPYL
jgi:superfamily II DNA or RNA helicase